MEILKETAKLESDLKDLKESFKESYEALELKIKQHVNDIQKFNNQLGDSEVAQNLISELNEKEKKLENENEKIIKPENSLKKIKSKKRPVPVKHPNMPYIESILELGNDEKITDYDEESPENIDSDDHVPFVPHPNINIKRDPKLLRRLNEKSKFSNCSCAHDLLTSSHARHENNFLINPIVESQIKFTKSSCNSQQSSMSPSSFSRLNSMPNISESLAYCQNCDTFASVVRMPSIILTKCKSITTFQECERDAKMMTEDDVRRDKKPSKSVSKKPSIIDNDSEGCGGCGICKDCEEFSRLYEKIKKKSVAVTNSHGDTYEHMKQVIENQNEKISNIQSKIQISALKNENVEKLTTELQNEKSKLSKLVDQVILEQREHKDETWQPIKIFEL